MSYELMSRPFKPSAASCCEQCVYGHGEHAAWCPKNVANSGQETNSPSSEKNVHPIQIADFRRNQAHFCSYYGPDVKGSWLMSKETLNDLIKLAVRMSLQEVAFPFDSTESGVNVCGWPVIVDESVSYGTFEVQVSGVPVPVRTLDE